MKQIRYVTLALVPLMVQGCIYIPGSVIGKVQDSFTGHEGENCLGVTAKVGDKITLSDGNVGVVKSISGASSRCPNPDFPSRALVEPIAVANYSGKLALNLPTDWKNNSITNVLASQGVAQFATNGTGDLAITLSVFPRNPKQKNVEGDARAFRDMQIKGLVNATSSDLQTINYQGFAAYRFSVSGRRDATGLDLTYLFTLVPMESEVATIKAWSKTAEYNQYRKTLEDVSNSLNVIK